MAIRALDRPRDAPVRRRLFCFPYAGGGASIFRQWPEHLPPDVEVCIPCLPGRDARVGEPPVAAMAPLVASLAPEMRKWLTVPYALFGHSMGAFIAFDLAHELATLGHPPAHLFVSAQRGPRVPYRGQPIFALPNREFLAGVLERYDNIPKTILEQKDMMAVLLPMLRADFTLSEDYRYRATGSLTCPIAAFAGEQDGEVLRPEIEDWSRETTGRFALHMLPGGHFFPQTARAGLLSLIRRDLP
jgi:medium-chain acyl-[acyl-carrier-protein] hydrolase